MSPQTVEWLGYAASIVILISLLMSSVIKLRWINMAGALLFTIYGALIDALPVAVVNFGIVLIDIYYIVQYYKDKEIFRIVGVDMDSEIFKYFVEQNKEDIGRQTDIDELGNGYEALFMLRDNNIAGIMIGRKENDTFDIKLDYVTPKYRDFKLGEYYFVEHPGIFKEKGIERLKAYGKSEEHRNYLHRIGFKKLDDKENEYEKKL